MPDRQLTRWLSSNLSGGVVKVARGMHFVNCCASIPDGAHHARNDSADLAMITVTWITIKAILKESAMVPDYSGSVERGVCSHTETKIWSGLSVTAIFKRVG